ncbi:N-acetylmuramoyl-L-alanine amidase family protein [Candidatus Thioglobus autotrophicus]|uniref:N-acetylmuramoyl-L-alanine amidase family protein n=1 Tax=Candidatus Thioglobus autotrophicus TaxID=1705394 RepID=UPI00299DBC92|nr:N-acetylmuramoyl-L-alanine amidase [Candidatus Thioglobus autotrophicus]WPE17637.1 N-acetylmuramoyl-L-alanine amidase [Candidatus Thioglobus autotrophicus]
MHRLISLLIGLFFLSSAFADNRTTLHDFRFWSSPERTRIVIDVDQGVRFSINQQQNQFTLGIRNAKLLKDTYKKLFFTDQRIKKTRVKRDDTTYQFKFKLHGQYQIKSYTLKPNDKYRHHRLVIDLYDQKNQTTKAVKKPKKSLSKISVSKQHSTRIILIDAGHGGEDPGAIGYKRSKEKRITLSIAKKLSNKINATRGMKAVLTRRGDYYVGLTQRIRIAQANQASLFVSIHADAVKSRRAKGASVYILSERGGSTNFARRLEKSQNTADQFGVKQKLNSKDQYLNKILWDLSRKDRDTQSQKLGTKILQQMQKIGHLHKKKPQKAGFVVLKTPAIPSVLVETAFISNPEEERRLNSNKEQDKIANAIYQGILNYYK